MKKILWIIGILILGLNGCEGAKETSAQESETTMPEFALAVVANKEGKYGYIDMEGNEVIECKYYMAYEFSENGLAGVGRIDEATGEWRGGYINKHGEEVIPLIYTEVCEFGDSDLAWVKNEEDKYGCINENGDVIIPFEYDSIELNAFSGESWDDGWTEVAVNIDCEGNIEPTYRYGYVNRQGETIECKYVSVEEFDNEGTAVVGIEDGDDVRTVLINEQGEEVREYDYNLEKFDENGLAVATENGYKEGMTYYEGMINKEGEVIIDFKYTGIRGFEGNELTTAFVFDFEKEIMKSYIIDQSGKEILSTDYDIVTDYQPDKPFGATLDGEKYGCINVKGEEVVPFIYDGINDFDKNGLAEVELLSEEDDGRYIYYKYGFINDKGEEVIECIHDYVEYTDDTNWIVTGIINGTDENDLETYLCKYYDTTGKMVLELPEEYIYAGYFKEIK